jgi:hypothetical protein
VLAIAETTDTSSAAALQAAGEVGATADTLRVEVTDFLTAMSSGNEAERRLYERVPGGTARATLHIGGTLVAEASIGDISRGGMVVRHDSKIAVGADLEISLPGGVSVKARIVRCGNGEVAVAFRQDGETLGRIDKALAIIGQAATRRAA